MPKRSAPSSNPAMSPRFNLEQLRKRAKDLKRAHADNGLAVAERIRRALPGAEFLSLDEIAARPLRLAQAQRIVARENGFASWPRLKHRVEELASDETHAQSTLITAAMVGDRELVDRLLALYPELVAGSLHVAAALADERALGRCLAAPEAVLVIAGPFACPPLVYACCARLGANEPDERAARVAVVQALIERGADARCHGVAHGCAPRALGRGRETARTGRRHDLARRHFWRRCGRLGRRGRTPATCRAIALSRRPAQGLARLVKSRHESRCRARAPHRRSRPLSQNATRATAVRGLAWQTTAGGGGEAVRRYSVTHPASSMPQRPRRRSRRREATTVRACLRGWPGLRARP